ncbi:hypothetical protein AMTR_s00037p00079030 [Amborella trichopoda]|uniref:Uncharacterized protein n=1 Tax=Amborella trichopoda TaxID=13333 RepID=U5DA94_AMBTC|nr:hypothetical protein AMTR_s00037p00079030 [Amborella trichopoda]
MGLRLCFTCPPTGCTSLHFPCGLPKDALRLPSLWAAWAYGCASLAFLTTAIRLPPSYGCASLAFLTAALRLLPSYGYASLAFLWLRFACLPYSCASLAFLPTAALRNKQSTLPPDRS